METKDLKEILEKHFKTYGVYDSLDNDGDKAIDSILLAMQEVAKLSQINLFAEMRDNLFESYEPTPSQKEWLIKKAKELKP